MDIKIVIRTTTKSALKTENRVINSAHILMVSSEFMHFPLFPPLFVLFSFNHVLLSFLLFIHGKAGWSFQSKKGKGKKKNRKKPTTSSSNWPTWRLETTRGSKRYEDNRGFIKMFSSLPEERAVRTGREGEGGREIIWPKQV